MVIFIILVVLLIMMLIINKMLSFDKRKNNNCSNEYYEKKLMTKNEEYFYNIFKKLANENNLIVHPQINLATIIEKRNSKYRNELFRNIDFAFFSNDYKKLLLLIEINDSTHKKKKRLQRDEKVKNICNIAKIKLITFYTNKPNEENYIKSRILKNIVEDTLQ